MGIKFKRSTCNCPEMSEARVASNHQKLGRGKERFLARAFTVSMPQVIP